jgi:hypothetical protein
MIAQLDMFGATTLSTSLVGLHVTLPNACRCGATSAVLGSSSGPHYASLVCGACDRHRGWLSADTFNFISATIDNFGRPVEPITIRFSNSRVSADL